MRGPQPLPIDKLVPLAVEHLRQAPALVLRSPTGSGKTTRLPPALEAAGMGPVLLLEPRRLSARAAAARMAQEAQEPLGERFGYRVRFDKKVGPRTRVTAVTEGIFLRQLLSDPLLEGVGCVVFDEFHERHLEGDLALALVRRIQQEVRPDLRIVVLSATLDTQPLEAFLDARVITSEGRLFPVEVVHQAPQGREALEDQVLRACAPLCEAPGGDLLVFLPGKGEIRRCERALAGLARQHALQLHSLHGELKPAAQDAALRRGQARKLILSTNLAESSVTVDGVSVVIDSGWARIPRFDAARGIDQLELTRISRQSVQQRAGRAGRQGPGLNLRLWSQLEEQALAEVAEPEVKRVDISGAWLSLLDFGEAQPAEFPWFEAPEPLGLERAEGLLQALGAARPHGTGWQITERGRELARLPLTPRLGRLLLAGRELGCLGRAALAAALISERDPLSRALESLDPQRVVESDVLERVELLEDHERGRGPRELQRGAAHQVLAVRDQLLRNLEPADRPSAADADGALLEALFVAYADRLAKRRSQTTRSKQKKRTRQVAHRSRFQTAQGLRAQLADGRGVRLGRNSHVHDASLFVCIELAASAGEAEVRLASGVQREWLDAAGFEESFECTFDSDTEQVRLLRVKRWRGLKLQESSVDGHERHADAAVASALAEAASARIESALDWNQEDFQQLISRWNCLAEWAPELRLQALVPSEWALAQLPKLARGCRSFADLRRIQLAQRLRSSLDPGTLRKLDQWLPARLELPAGRSAAILYSAGQAPVLSVRIQHLFGVDATPTLLSGRVTMVLHLCAPNGRPEQITSDLPGFWRGSYALVRKELRGRYPKHDWPEDPLSAKPQPARRGDSRRAR